nr:hypothetical protein [uncultured bacterium]
MHDSQTHLLEIALATGAPCVFPGPCKCGKQNSRQYCYYSDNDKQLN